MERRRIRKIFQRYYGSSAWASSLLGVTEGTISGWLRGHKDIPEERLARLTGLAGELEATKGECLKTVQALRLLRVRRPR